MPTAALLTAPFPVSPTDPALGDLQGNILKGHGRAFTHNLFLSFKPGQQERARNWIAGFSSVFVTSARKQLADTQRFRQRSISGGLFSSFYLSAAGYAYLGVEAAKMPADPEFGKGMKQAALQDPDPATWDAGLSGAQGPIHAMLLVADANASLVRAFATAIQFSLSPIATVVTTERGAALRNANGDGIEHNNYVDGISQPVFFEDELPAATDQWDPRAAPALMVVPDPGGQDENSLGSYFVFRKLEQNVRGFKAREKEAAKAIFNLPADQTTWTAAQQEQAELVGAWAVGRFEDGTPVVLHGSGQHPAPDQQLNNFNFLAADSASKCPYHAHIRKTGPRTDGPGGTSTAGNATFNKTKRLVRRGIPYENAPRIRDANGELSDRPEDLPTGGVGLLFMCYVADIAKQFEFVQQKWVNSPTFANPNPVTGKDPLIGQPTDGTVYHWPTGYGEPGRVDAPFGDFITLRGGEYFFAPSLSMLQSLRTIKIKLPGFGIKVPVATTQPVRPLPPGDPAPVVNSGSFHPELLPHLQHVLADHPQLDPLLDPLLHLFVPEQHAEEQRANVAPPGRKATGAPRPELNGFG